MPKKQNIQKYFNQRHELTLTNPTYKRQLKTLTTFFINEDLGGKGDVTSDLMIKNNKIVTAKIIAKESGILAGLTEVIWLASSYKLQVTSYKNDGDKIMREQNLFKLKGRIKTILQLERTLLNILQRMSGIATQTNKLVKLTNNKVLICPTRKTQWGLLDKKAVTLGGGGTHRLGLYDWPLIKDNHLKIANFKFQISNFHEIEVTNEKELLQALKHNPGAIMLDNFSPTKIKKIFTLLNRPLAEPLLPVGKRRQFNRANKYYLNINKTIIEASGGINEKNIAEYAKTGVDVISIGALTHSTKALDISLDII